MTEFEMERYVSRMYSCLETSNVLADVVRSNKAVQSFQLNQSTSKFDVDDTIHCSKS